MIGENEGMSFDSELDNIAAELYLLRPEEFVAERDRRVRAVRQHGDRDLARAVERLRRPTSSAWLVNLLVHSHPDAVQELLTLGEQLREAQVGLAGPALRELSAQRHQVIAALVQRARRLAHDAQHPVSEEAAREAEATLDAALADPGVARAVLGGRLVHATGYAGFGTDGDRTPVVEPFRQSHPGWSAASDDRQDQDLERRRLEQATRAEAAWEAAEAANRAGQEVADRDAELRAGREQRDVADATVARLTEELSAAQLRLSETNRRLATSRQRREQAVRSFDRARRRAEQARAAAEQA